MKFAVVAVVVLLACAVSAQNPAGWRYNPFLYFPYSALQPPAQETAEVMQARLAHEAAHAAARGKRSIVQDTPEVQAATIEFYRAYNQAALANGIVAYLPARYANMPWAMPQPVAETPEVVAARRAHEAAHALARARGKRNVVQDTPEVQAATIEFYRAYNQAALANGIVAYLPARYANMPWAMPQPVAETPEVVAARRAHEAAHALARARGKRNVVQDTPEVQAATIEFYRAYNQAALANGIVAYLPARYPNMPWAMPQPVAETPEVVAARRAHEAAHALARARLG